MKKIIIVLGIILTSGIAALALSQNKSNEVEIARIKADRNELILTKAAGNFKSNIATAD